MGVIGKLINTAMQNYIINTVEKKAFYNIKGESYSSPGDDSPGLEDDRVYLANIEGQGRSVVLGTFSISRGAQQGEKILYSRAPNGDVKAKIYIKADGGIEIVGDGNDVEINTSTNLVLQSGTDFAVRNNELKTQIDSLKQTLNDFINNQHNGSVVPHTHIFNYNAGPTPSSGSTAPAVITTGIQSTADFTNIKVSNINVPGIGE